MKASELITILQSVPPESEVILMEEDDYLNEPDNPVVYAVNEALTGFYDPQTKNFTEDVGLENEKDCKEIFGEEAVCLLVGE
jgi:hypothetical protein